MTRGIAGALLLCATLIFSGADQASAQSASNPMRRLLQREATPAPTARPAVTPAPESTPRGSATSGGRQSSRTRNAAREGSDSTDSDSGRSSSLRRSAERTPRPTPDPNALLVKAANDATTVVARFLQAANDGKYSTARNLLTPEVQQYFDSELSAVHGDLMGILDDLTKDGQLTLIRYPLANVRGEGITVVAEMQYRDNSSAQHRFRVVEVNKNYRIALDVSHFIRKRASIVPDATAVTESAPRPINPTDNIQSTGTSGVSSASEDIITGSGVVTRPNAPPASTILPRVQATPLPEPVMTPVTDDQPTTQVINPNEGTLQDRPWQPAPTN